MSRLLVSVALGLLPAAGRAQAPVLEQQNTGTKVRLQAVSAVSDSVVWASGTRGTYVKTTDGGATWGVGVVPGADSLEFRDVHGFDAKRAVLLASGPGDKSRIYHTANGGASWDLVFQNKEPAAFYDCFDFAGPVGVVVSDAVGGHFPLMKTVNSGRTWHGYQPPGHGALAALAGEGAFAASGTCLTMTSDGTAWVGTAGGARVLRFGIDRTEAFATPVVHDTVAGISTLAFQGKRGIAAGGDLRKPNDFTANVAVTEDGGRTWTLAGRPAFPGPVFGLGYLPGRDGVLVAVSPKGASWSADGGRTWAALDPNDYWGIGFAPSGTGWISGPNGRIARIRMPKR